MSRPEGRRRWFFRAQVILALGALAAVLVPLFLLEIPWPEGDRDYLVDRGREETGAQNLVSSLYLGYRVFDTLGETIVLLLAVTGTVGLIRSSPRVPGNSGASRETPGGDGESRRRFRGKRTVLMEVVAGKLGPVVLMFGLYVMLFGHVSPGGGFQGGAVVASGMIFLYLGAGDRSVTVLSRRDVLERLEAMGFLLFVLAALAGVAVGSGFFANPLVGTPLPPEGFIVLLNVVIGLKVGAGMASMCAVMMEEERT